MSLPMHIWRRGYDLVLIMTVMLISLVTFSFAEDSSFYRLVTLPTLLFSPGYLCAGVFYPELLHLRVSERIVYSMALSVAIHILIGMTLNQLPIGLQSLSYLMILFTLCLSVSALVYILRTRLEQQHELQMDMRDLIYKPVLTSGIVRLAWFPAVLVAVFGVLSLIGFYPSQPTAPATTQLVLEILNIDQNRVSNNAEAEVRSVLLSVTNAEGRTVSYNLHKETMEKQEQIATFTLESGRTWSATVDVAVAENKQSQQIAFLLYQDGALNNPIRTVYFWLPPNFAAVANTVND